MSPSVADWAGARLTINWNATKLNQMKELYGMRKGKLHDIIKKKSKSYNGLVNKRLM